MTVEALKKMRRKAGLSQWSVARAVGRTQAWLSNIEMGYVTLPEEELSSIASAIETLGKHPGRQGNLGGGSGCGCCAAVA